MRILFFLTLFAILTNCTTVNVVKEVTKASKSVKTSVDNILRGSGGKSHNDPEKNSKKISNDKLKIDQEIKNLQKEKEEKIKIIKEQKKEVKITLLGKTSNEVMLMFGEPDLIRVDGNSRTMRFDNNFCQLFLFSLTKLKNARVDYFEIRNKEGNLIINKKNIDKCYKSFKLT
jgi:hypothetical protein